MTEINQETADAILEWAKTCWNYKTGLKTFTGLVKTLVSEDDGMTMQEVKDTYFPDYTIEELRDTRNDYLTQQKEKH